MTYPCRGEEGKRSPVGRGNWMREAVGIRPAGLASLDGRIRRDTGDGRADRGRSSVVCSGLTEVVSVA